MSHQATTDNPYTRGIAQFVSGLKYGAIPESVRSRIKLLMLDALGCALYGDDLEWSRILQERLTAIDTTRMERTVDSAGGSEHKFASESDIVEKFEKLAVKALPKSQVAELRDAMLGLEKLKDANALARLLATRPPVAHRKPAAKSPSRRTAKRKTARRK